MERHIKYGRKDSVKRLAVYGTTTSTKTLQQTHSCPQKQCFEELYDAVRKKMDHNLELRSEMLCLGFEGNGGPYKILCLLLLSQPMAQRYPLFVVRPLEVEHKGVQNPLHLLISGNSLVKGKRLRG